MPKEKVLVGMSGGVDSSTTVLVLQEQGYEVIGMKFKVINSPAFDSSIDIIENYTKSINVPFHVIDVRDDFKSQVISNFKNEYLAGRTPNPCVLCNKMIKWKNLIQLADKLNCKWIATGHYAKINQTNGRYYISKGTDNTKDQSYFLWRLSQEYLSRTIFPLGNYTKNEIKKIALSKGLDFISNQKESMEICFIPDNDYRNYLSILLNEDKTEIKEGNIISTTGEVLGTHKGIYNYTIGQRKGLKIALGYPVHVIDINTEANTVTLGKPEELNKNELWIKDFNLMKYDNISDIKNVITKIRYKNIGYESELALINNKIKISFKESIPGITSGQSAVFYENDDIIGGGIIE